MEGKTNSFGLFLKDKIEIEMFPIFLLGEIHFEYRLMSSQLPPTN